MSIINNEKIKPLLLDKPLNDVHSSNLNLRQFVLRHNIHVYSIYSQTILFYAISDQQQLRSFYN